jgi:hypothetical protein
MLLLERERAKTLLVDLDVAQAEAEPIEVRHSSTLAGV